MMQGARGGRVLQTWHSVDESRLCLLLLAAVCVCSLGTKKRYAQIYDLIKVIKVS